VTIAATRLPTDVAARLAVFIDRLDRALPGRVEAAWLEGSLALDDFHPRVSDVDLVLVTRAPVAPAECARVRRWQSRRERPPIAVAWWTWDEVAMTAARDCARIVSAAILHRHGIALRGPHPSTVVPDVAAADLVGAMLQNLDYWRAWRRRALRRPIGYLKSLHPQSVAWGVLGVPRQYVTVREGRVVSKLAAAAYVRERFAPRWHRVLDEAVRLRTGAPGPRYASPFARRREMLGFLEYAIARTSEVAS